MTATLAELAELAGGRIVGDGGRPVHGVATLTAAGPEDLSFLGNRRYRAQLRDTRAAAVLLTEDDVPECPVDAIVVPDSYVAYARVAARFCRTLTTQSVRRRVVFATNGSSAVSPEPA